MNNKKLIEAIRIEIKRRLQAKNSWGKNEAIAEIEAAIADAAAHLLDELEDMR